MRANGGGAGGDGVTLDDFAQAAAARLSALSAALRAGIYHPAPLRRLDIAKPDGGSRPLAIPAILDRIAQTAVAQALSPIFEREFSDASFGYRPNRSVRMAVERIAMLRRRGFTHVVEGDIVRYFENVPHDPLLTLLETQLPDEPRLCALIGLWLEHGGQMLGTPGRGLAQGSPLSPLLSNLYLDSFDDTLTAEAALVRFADDFILLTRKEADAHAALARAAEELAARGLAVDAAGSKVTDFDAGFAFLGHLFLRSLVLKSEGADPVPAPASGAETETDAGYDPGPRVLRLFEPGRRLGLGNDSFRVLAPDGAVLVQLAQHRVGRIEIGPCAGIDDDALRQALGAGIEIAHLDGLGQVLGTTMPAAGDHGALHLAQARVVLDPALRLALALQLVSGRIRNQRARLQVLNRRAETAKAVKAAQELGICLRRLRGVKTLEALRGVEGLAAAVYWPALASLCAGAPKRFTRQRPARDALNAVLNYLCALLERDIRAAILSAGLHPGFGVLHASTDRGEGCVYDLMEGFRALLTEGVAVTLFNRKVLRPEHFTEDGARISPAGQRAIIEGYEAALDRVVRSNHSGARHKLRVVMREEARAFARHCRAPDQGSFEPQVQDY
ncbi:CRISPR-associated endonuclease Cas1 [Rhodobacter capsulatus]|uniref:CRISPR-associated endonuclease Cas1 n=1 Tax=Rhodobacter capsulatus TaxID=1061 RepID=UPI001BAFA9AD|nr:CRISPR-associated endonuclease Cas1 [Rhodobacter capsulatus]